MTEAGATDERLALLLEQLDAVWEMLDARLAGRHPWRDASASTGPNLTDAEYFWEPVPGCWSLRRRGQALGPNPVGKGEWLLDGGHPEPQPPPFTTIAWRMCHIALWLRMRYDYTFGSHSLTLDDITWPSNAVDACAFLRASYKQWHTALGTVTTADLDQIGRSQMPYGLDPNVQFAGLLAWTNTEFAHHAAEIGCLRDLYRASGGATFHDRVR